MSDTPPRGPGNPPATTVPLAAQPAPAGAVVMRHPATQLSPSAVPSTLESPQDPRILLAPDATRVDRPIDLTRPSTAAGDAPNGATLRDDTARDAAVREAVRLADAAIVAASSSASGAPSARRHGPATQMSPMLDASTAPPAPPLAAEDAVVDAILPPAAFVPPPPGATLDMGNGGYADAPQHAGWGAPGAHAGAFEARDPWQAAHGGRPPPPMAPAGRDGRLARGRSNGTLIALLAGGVVVLVLGIGIIGGGMYVLSRRAAARAARTAKAADAPAAGLPGASPGAGPGAGTGDNGARAQPRANEGRAQGGTKAKVTLLTSGSLDAEGTRVAVKTVLPRIDACFAASELEAPNHETAAYDLDVGPTGAVTRAEPATQSGRAPTLDSCVTSALRGARLPRSPGGSKVKVILTARIDPQLPR